MKAHLSLNFRTSDCKYLQDAWRIDLVIMTCNGQYLSDFQEKLKEDLEAKYPTYVIQILPNYMGHTRISIIPPNKGINHIQMDILPGCYTVWARVCHNRNEETNKVMVMARCDDIICQNLLLNSPNTCSNEGVFPIGLRAVQMNLPYDEIKNYLMVMKAVANVKKADLQAWANDRLNELNLSPGDGEPPTYLIQDYEQLRDRIDELPNDTTY